MLDCMIKIFLYTILDFVIHEKINFMCKKKKCHKYS